MPRALWVAIVAVLAFSGCDTSSHESPADQPAGGSVTLWTEKTELFLEYPALIVGTEIGMASHLSWMSDFKPVTEGTVVFRFTSSTNETIEVTESAPVSPGIYRPRVSFRAPGTYRLIVHLAGRVKDTLMIDPLQVYALRKDVPEEPAIPGSGQEISFLKEQQWRTDFRTARVRKERIGSSIRSAAEVIPAVNGEAIVAAPFTGFIPADINLNLPVPGMPVKRGETLAVIHPSAETPGGSDDFASRYTNAETERDLTRRELERVRQLFARASVSEKEFQEADADFRRAEATFTSLSTLAIAERDSSMSPGGFRLAAPLTGTITEMHVIPGQQVDAGAPLFRIINLDRVWIRANIVANDIGKIRNPSTAWFMIAGRPTPVVIDQRNGRLISIGSVIDGKTRTLPVIFQRSNAERTLRIGMVGELRITGNDVHVGLVIPQSALMEEEGRYSVYVHTSGESFVKRDVVLGAQDPDRVEVVSGLIEGERVVTVGAYQVKLSSLSTQLPAHGHVH
jgi:RND family efflux transporter MFP subunit